MLIKSYFTKEEWLEDRKGKIGGSSLSDIVVKSAYTKDDIVKVLENSETEFDKKLTKDSLFNLLTKEQRQYLICCNTEEKIGFYQIIADRIAKDADGENAMERGTRLEEEAIEKVSAIIGKEINTSLVSWAREDNPQITVSPDGFIGETEAVEIKCLGTAKHIEAIVTDKMPSEYEFQRLQYFIVNDNLKTLYFALYDPRMPEKHQIKMFTINREDLEEDIETYKVYQEEKLSKIEDIINTLTF